MTTAAPTTVPPTTAVPTTAPPTCVKYLSSVVAKELDIDTFVNDTVQLNLDLGIDVSGYSEFIIKYKKPDGTTGCWTAALCSSDNERIIYTCVHGDLDISGDWLVQALVRDTGVQLHGRWNEFKVHSSLAEFCTTVAPTTVAPTTAAP